jgi:hypothetical protein
MKLHLDHQICTFSRILPHLLALHQPHPSDVSLPPATLPMMVSLAPDEPILQPTTPLGLMAAHMHKHKK